MPYRELSHGGLLLVLALALGCGGETGEVWRGRLESPPRPKLETPEPAFLARIEQLEGDIEKALTARPFEPARLAEAEGELGLFYLAYLEVEIAPVLFENAARVGPADWRWPYLLGFVAQTRGDLVAAESFYQTAKKLKAEEIGPRLRLAEILLEQGKAGDAGRELAEILRQAPDLPAALYQEARRLSREGQDAAAAALLEKVLAAQPSAGAARHLLGGLYRKLGRENDARRELAAAGEQRVLFDDPLLGRLDDLGVSESFYRVRASRAFKSRDYAAAASALRRLFELGEGSFGDRQRYAFCLYRLGDRDGAARELSLAQKRPDAKSAPAGERSEAFRLAGALLLEKGDAASAARELRQAVAVWPGLEPGHEAARLLLAEALVRGGDPGAAIEVFSAWLAAEPAQPRALLERGLLRLAGGEKAGLRDLKAAAEAAPGDPLLQRRCGEAFERAGDLAAARRAFENAVRAAPPAPGGEEAFSRALALAHLANLERRDGRLERAETLYRESLTYLPAFEVRLNLADLLLARGEPAAAAELYAAARAQDPGHLDARLGEVAALILQGRFPAARQALEAGVAELPRAGELRHLLARLLAIAPDAGDRQAGRALELALAVVQAKATSQHAETLAMALAESGRTAEAAGLLREIIAEGRRRGEGPGVLAWWQEQLRAYESGQPFRANPPARFFRPKS